MLWWVPAVAYGIKALDEYLGKKLDEKKDTPANPQGGQQSNLIADSGDNAAKTMKPVCPKCNTEYEEGTFFCKNDGEKLILK